MGRVRGRARAGWKESQEAWNNGPGRALLENVRGDLSGLRSGVELGTAIQDGRIIERHLGSNQIISRHVNSDQIIARHLANAQLLNRHYLANQIEGGFMVPDTVTQRELLHTATDSSRPVAAAALRDGAILEEKLATRAATRTKIAVNAVGPDELATSTTNAQRPVGSLNIQNLAVTEDRLGPDAVTRSKILDGEVIGAKIVVRGVPGTVLVEHAVGGFELRSWENNDTGQNANRAVGANHLRDQAVNGRVLADDAVTTTHLAQSAKNYIDARAEAFADNYVDTHYDNQHAPIINAGGFASRDWVNQRIDQEMTQHYDLRHGTATSVATHLTGHP